MDRRLGCATQIAQPGCSRFALRPAATAASAAPHHRCLRLLLLLGHTWSSSRHSCQRCWTAMCALLVSVGSTSHTTSESAAKGGTAGAATQVWLLH
jgi:hypothetical protein